MVIKITGATESTYKKIHDSEFGTFRDSLIMAERYCMRDSEGNDIEPILYDIFLAVSGDDSFSIFTINKDIIRLSINKGIAYIHTDEYAWIEFN